MNFVSPLLRLVGRSNHAFRAFFDRSISAPIGKFKLSGKVNMVVAIGKQRPVQPFFFFHEYKPEQKDANVPLGLLLASMLVADKKNEDKIPIYGCSVSDAFVASKEDIVGIFKNLRQVKTDISNYLARNAQTV